MNKHDFVKLEIPLIAQLFVVYEKAHKLIASLPKFERYTLGERIESNVLEAVELVVIGNGSSKWEKEKFLLKANAKIEILKLLYRLALNCGVIEATAYLEAERDLQEAGRQAQGWIRYARTL